MGALFPGLLSRLNFGLVGLTVLRRGGLSSRTGESIGVGGGDGERKVSSG